MSNVLGYFKDIKRLECKFIRKYNFIRFII